MSLVCRVVTCVLRLVVLGSHEVGATKGRPKEGIFPLPWWIRRTSWVSFFWLNDQVRHSGGDVVQQHACNRALARRGLSQTVSERGLCCEEKQGPTALGACSASVTSQASEKVDSWNARSEPQEQTTRNRSQTLWKKRRSGLLFNTWSWALPKKSRSGKPFGLKLCLRLQTPRC